VDNACTLHLKPSAWLKWTAAGVWKPRPEWRCRWLYLCNCHPGATERQGAPTQGACQKGHDKVGAVRQGSSADGRRDRRQESRDTRCGTSTPDRRLDIDLVAHCGSTSAGQFLFTLSTVDVATGWMLCYCDEESITPTRARPFRTNASCHVEQQNWSVVRRLVGYTRFEQDALPALKAVYTLAEDYLNFLQPVLKLVEKTRNGPRVRRRYDPAQTPYRRLLSLGTLAAATRHHLDTRYAAIHPIYLKTALEEAQTRTFRRCHSVTFG
jgi:hypothetical protein